MSTFLERAADRLNPIVVKDVRAAFRGRVFKLVLLGELALALVVGFLVLGISQLEASNMSGTAYFTAVFVCLALGVHGIVPFAAMHSIASERDEHTLELLQLSGLAAWRIVAGKLTSALLQALLVYSAFLPFIVFAFLLRGVPVETIVAALVVSAAICTAQCSGALAFGALAQSRWARVLLSVVLVIGLLYTAPFVFMALAMHAFGAVSVTRVDGTSGLVVVALTAAIGLSTFAAVLLAHAEENRSTPIRVATTFVCLVGSGFAFLADTMQSATVLLMITLLCSAAPMYFLTTEREALPRVVAAHPPRWAAAWSPLVAWLPGGGRGALFALLHFALVLLVHLVARAFIAPGGNWFDGWFVRLLTTELVLVFLLLLPSAVAARFNGAPSGVALARFVIALVVAGILIGPALLAVLFNDPSLSRWSPAFQPSEIRDDGTLVEPASWTLLAILAAVAVLASVPRMLRGFAEIRRLSLPKEPVEAARAAPQP